MVKPTWILDSVAAYRLLSCKFLHLSCTCIDFIFFGKMPSLYFEEKKWTRKADGVKMIKPP